MTGLPALLAAFVAATQTPLGWLTGTQRRKKAVPRALTPRYCANQLRQHDWKLTGAGPNYAVVYLERGPLKIALTTTVAEQVTENTVAAFAAEFAAADYAAGRRQVGVHAGSVAPEVVEHAASQGVVLVHAAALAQLEPTLRAADVAIAAHRQAQRDAMSRAYDPPEPAPLLPPVAPAAAPSTATGVAPAIAPGTASVPRLIGETERVACFLADRGGDILFVTFANQWLPHDGKRFMGDTLAARLGVSALGFVAATPNWYPPDDMARLVPLAQAALGGRFLLRVALGHSQGGHAALRHAAAFGARASLAFSPQFSIDPNLVADSRVNRHYAGYLHAGTAIGPGDGAGNGFVFFDPYDDADARHAARIAGVTGAETIAVPFAGHGTERGLLTEATFPALLAASLAGDAARMRRIAAGTRHRRPGRDVQMALVAAQRRPAVAARLLEARAGVWSPDQVAAVAFRAARAGCAAAALPPVLAAAAAAPASANVVGTAGLVALEAGELSKAAALLSTARKLAPHDAKFRDAERRLAARRTEAA